MYRYLCNVVTITTYTIPIYIFNKPSCCRNFPDIGFLYVAMNFYYLNLSNISRQLLFLLCLTGVRVGGVWRLRRTDDWLTRRGRRRTRWRSSVAEITQHQHRHQHQHLWVHLTQGYLRRYDDNVHKISKGLKQMIMDDNAVILDEKVFNICFDRPNWVKRLLRIGNLIFYCWFLQTC